MPDQPDSGKASGSWYAVQCRVLKEFAASAAIRERLGILAYLPTVVSRAHGVAKERPFFPGYFFVNVALDDVELSNISRMPGVVRLVQFGGERRPVPEEVISEIKGRLATLNAQGGLPGPRFHPGDTVRLRRGPFDGLQAIFLGTTTPRARAKVLLEFLGRPNEVQVDLEALTSDPDGSRPNGDRRTRGGGRRIRSVAVVGSRSG